MAPGPVVYRWGSAIGLTSKARLIIVLTRKSCTPVSQGLAGPALYRCDVRFATPGKFAAGAVGAWCVPTFRLGWQETPWRVSRIQSFFFSADPLCIATCSVLSLLISYCGSSAVA